MNKKIYYVIIVLSLFQTNIRAQEDQKKIRVAINGGLTQSFFSQGTIGLHDFEGFSIRQISLGYTIGFKFDYLLNPKTHITLGTTLYSLESRIYKYYDLRRTNRIASPQFSLELKYDLSNNEKERWYVSGGLVAQIIMNEVKSYYLYENLNNTVQIESTSRSFVNPLIRIGIGKREILNKGRTIEYQLSYNQGFKTVDTHTLTKITSTDPPLVSDFTYNGTSVNFIFIWYIKKNKII